MAIGYRINWLHFKRIVFGVHQRANYIISLLQLDEFIFELSSNETI